MSWSDSTTCASWTSAVLEVYAPDGARVGRSSGTAYFGCVSLRLDDLAAGEYTFKYKFNFGDGASHDYTARVLAPAAVTIEGSETHQFGNVKGGDNKDDDEDDKDDDEEEDDDDEEEEDKECNWWDVQCRKEQNGEVWEGPMQTERDGSAWRALNTGRIRKLSPEEPEEGEEPVEDSSNFDVMQKNVGYYSGWKTVQNEVDERHQLRFEYGCTNGLDCDEFASTFQGCMKY